MEFEMTQGLTLPQIEERLIERIRQPYPKNAPIVPGSTPVVSFGNPIKSTVVTLGINPSYEEFQDSNKQTLGFGQKRLTDHETLMGDYSEGLSYEQALQVLLGCYQYFERSPYQWFSEIEKVVLKPFHFSYQSGSAAHLDIIQWATDPVWSKIESKQDCQEMLDGDADFLRFQLGAYEFKYVLMNGKTVIEQVQSLGIVDLREAGTISFGNGEARSKLWSGQVGNKTFLGWNLNIQRHETTERNKTELTDWLRTQIL
jgi:hypothetical protein